MPTRRLIALPLVLPFALAAVPAQAQLLDPLLQALTGRVDVLEDRVVDVDVALTANVSALNAVQVQLAIDVAVIADLDARVTVNSSLIAANSARDDLQDGRLGVIETRADQNDAGDAGRDTAIAAGQTRNDGQDARLATAEGGLAAQDGRIGAVETRAAANDTRDDGQDALLAANTTLDSAQDVRLATGEARDDVQDGRLASNEAAIAAGTTRDDGQDVRIAASTARNDDQDVRIAANTTGIDTLRGDVAAGRTGLVRQADPAGPINVGASSGGGSVSFTGTAGDRRLTGVAAGIAPDDAATMGQLGAQATATLTAANAYTDQSMTAILDANERLLSASNGVLRRDLRAIASGTTAIAGLPQSFIPGKGMVGMSVGGTGGELAVALGLSKAFAGENPLVLRGGMALDTRRGDATYNASVGIHF